MWPLRIAIILLAQGNRVHGEWQQRRHEKRMHDPVYRARYFAEQERLRQERKQQLKHNIVYLGRAFLAVLVGVAVAILLLFILQCLSRLI